MACQEKIGFKYQIITKTYRKGQANPFKSKSENSFVSRFFDGRSSRNPNTDNEFLKVEQSSKSFQYTALQISDLTTTVGKMSPITR